MIRELNMDFQRYLLDTKNPLIIFIKFFHNPGMFFSIFYRIERYLLINSNLVLKFFGVIFYPLYFFITYYIFSYHIEPFAKIGGGIYAQ